MSSARPQFPTKEYMKTQLSLEKSVRENLQTRASLHGESFNFSIGKMHPATFAHHIYYLSGKTLCYSKIGRTVKQLLLVVLANQSRQATTPNLEQKLEKLAPADAVAGLIAPYFVERESLSR
ncbi:uncharacterized protein LOC135150569 isoform X2 [Daucus carota subsp. sativus]